MDIDSLVNEKIEGDADFQATIAELPDDEKAQAIETKRKEVLTQEFSGLKEKADKLTKAEELAENYKIRAEKAEKAAKGNDAAAPQKTDDLSTKDLYVLIEAKVPPEDVSVVTEYAELKKISVADALKKPIVLALLKEKAEERETANATFTGRSRAAPAKVSNQDILNQARRGTLPESDADIAKLAEAELEAKLAARKK